MTFIVHIAHYSVIESTTNMPSCSIVGCGIRKSKNRQNVSLHRLPKNNKKRKMWLDTVGVENLKTDMKFISICSLHFEESCFNRTLNKTILRDDAVPSPIFLPLTKDQYKEQNMNKPVTRQKKQLTKLRKLETLNSVESDSDHDITNDDKGIQEKVNEPVSSDPLLIAIKNLQKIRLNIPGRAMKIINELKQRDEIRGKEFKQLKEQVVRQERTIVKLRALVQRAKARYDSDATVCDDEDPLELEDQTDDDNIIDIEKKIKINTVLKPGTIAVSDATTQTAILKVPVVNNKSNIESASNSPSPEPVVLGYVCDKAHRSALSRFPLATSGNVTETPEVVASAYPLGRKEVPSLDKKELRLRLVTNIDDGAMYEIVSDDEMEWDGCTDTLNTDIYYNKPRNKQFWKSKLNHILHNPRFCGICLDPDEESNMLTDHFEILLHSDKHNRKLADIANVVFNYTENLLSNTRICNSCTTNLIQSFIFIENARETAKMFNNHLTELYNKTCYIRNKVKSKQTDIQNVVFSLYDTKKHNIEINIKNNQNVRSKFDKYKNRLLKYDFDSSTNDIDSIIEYESRNVNHKCRICHVECKTSESLTKHFSLHFKSKCRICNGLVQDGGLLAHLKKCHRNDIHICYICDVVYYTNVALEAHKELWHRNYDSKCVTCLRSYNKYDLKSHTCRFKCPECDEAPCVHYKYLMSYREQMLNLSARAKCPDCNFITINLIPFMKHVVKEHF